MAESAPEKTVQPVDTVLDVVGHVGVFTAFALDRGAAKVIALEPDPLNAECLRRNFAAEIQSGRVIVREEGAWSSESTITLNTGVSNSGMGSMVLKEEGSQAVQVRVRPIDAILKELGIDKVHFIKMDIEGAERDALKGAHQTLAMHHPRLMIDMYHRPDDSQVLPAVIHAAYPGYQTKCGPCELNGEGNSQIIPHVTFFF